METSGEGNADFNEVILNKHKQWWCLLHRVLDLSTCNQWHVDFDFRAWEGNGADGLAFCFLDVPPTDFFSGGGFVNAQKTFRVVHY